MMNESGEEYRLASDIARRRRRWWVAIVAGVLAAAVLFPWILAKTSLRDRLLNAIVASDDVRASSSDASFGYFSALRLDGLKIESVDGAAVVDVERIEADHSWLGLLFSRPELGKFHFQRPRIDVRVNPDRDEPEKSVTSQVDLPVLAAEICNAAVVIRSSQSEKPPIDIDGIDLTIRLEKDSGQSLLRIDPSTVFDHQALTPELCGQGLQLIAPLLADSVDADGAFSLRLDEFAVPVNQSGDRSATRVRGELQLHHATVDLKSTLATRIAGTAIKLVGRELPQTISVVEGVNVRFEVVEGRFHHEGLALLLPHQDSSIEISSSGSVGLDESLDLKVSISLPKGMLGDSTIGAKMTEKPLVLAIGGTLDEPKIGLPETGNWLRDGTLEETVTDILGGLMERRNEREKSTVEEPLLPKLRQRLQERQRRTSSAEPEDI